MAHPTLTGSGAGAWFVRLGHIEGAWLDWVSLFGAAATTNVLSGAQVPTRLAQIEGDLAAGTADYPVASGIQAFTVTFQGTPANVGSQLASQVQQLLIDMTNLDSPLPITTIAGNPTAGQDGALSWLIKAMKADAATINQGTLPAAGAQTNGIAATPVGNPTFVLSVVDGAGRALQYVYPETLTFTITQDAQNGATAGQEPYSVTGQNGNTNPFSFDWLLAKYGSGAQGSSQLVDPMTNFAAGGTGNLLVNGAVLVATTANQADNWTIQIGSAGSTVTVTAVTGGYITGSGNITMASDGATQIAITQSFNTAVSTGVGLGGSPYVLLASAVNNTQYVVYVPYKMSVSSPAAGVLEVALVDGSANFSCSQVVSVQAGGATYAVGDTITLTGGTFSQAVILKVLTLSGSAVATASIVNPGNYTVVPANPVAQGSTSGSGTGATFNLSFGTGIVILDDAGTLNVNQVALTGVADTNWHILTSIFRLPQLLPATTPYKLRIRQSTAVTNAKSVLLSDLAMAVPAQLYAGGPYYAGFRGSTNPNASGAYPDSWTIGVTATIGKVQRAMWRWIGPQAVGTQTPGYLVPAVVSTSATISDALVV